VITIPYDKKNFYPRLNDGVYAENLGSTSILNDCIIVHSEVNLPSQFTNSIWDTSGTTQKARWLDIKYNNGNITNNNTSILVNDFIEFKLEIVLTLFNKLEKLIINSDISFVQVLWYDENHSNETDITNSLSDLRNLNLNSNIFYLKLIGPGTTLNTLGLGLVTLKSNSDDTFEIGLDNITDLTNSLNNKLDKISTTGGTRVYGISSDGSQTQLGVSASGGSNNLVFRDGNGVIKAGAEGVSDLDTVTMNQHSLNNLGLKVYAVDTTIYTYTWPANVVGVDTSYYGQNSIDSAKWNTITSNGRIIGLMSSYLWLTMSNTGTMVTGTTYIKSIHINTMIGSNTNSFNWWVNVGFTGKSNTVTSVMTVKLRLYLLVAPITPIMLY